MIDFIAHDFWSAAWLGCLIGFGAFVLWRGDAAARRVLWCFVGNWLGTRSLVTLWPDANLSWMVLDAATVAALVLYGRSFAANAVAVLFTLILTIDLLVAGGAVSDLQAKAMGDLLGFLGLLVMAGASSNDNGGKRDYVFDWLGLGNRGAVFASPRWRPILARSRSSGETMGSNQKAVP